MADMDSGIIVGVLGQWASGKSTAADTLVSYLGGEEEVIFITDRKIVAGLAMRHILEFEVTKLKRTIGDDGRECYEGDWAKIFLNSGEDLETVDLNTLRFDFHDQVYDNVPIGEYNFMDIARIDLGNQICQHSTLGKPIVVEAGFGTNTELKGENPFHHSVSDLFELLEEAGVQPTQVKWIIIQSSYQKRRERNRKRKDTVPEVEFDRFAADGGDLTPGQEVEWTAKGANFVRVNNDHDDLDVFKADIIAAFKDLF